MVGRIQKRSLAEELAELATPAPAVQSLDPEELHEFGIEALRLHGEDEVEDYGGAEPLQRELRGKQAAAHLPLRGDLSAFHGEEFEGRRSSRRAALGSNGFRSDDDGAGEGEQELQGASSADKLEPERSGRATEAATWQGAAGLSPPGGDGEEALVPLGQDGELDALEKEYALLKAEEAEVLKKLKPSGATDRSKGIAVAHQHAIWDGLLALRISLQKPLTAARRLPDGRGRAAFCGSDEATARAYAEVAASARRTVALLQQLSQAIVDQNGAIGDAAASAGKRKRAAEHPFQATAGSVEDVWAGVEAGHAELAPFCAAAADRWQRKTLLSSGAAAMRGRLRALNQNISEQVSAAMRNPDRMIQRTRLRPSPEWRVLGQEQGDGEPGGDEGNPETFDDADFYQQLLREFLEAADPTSLGALGVHRMRNKGKKKGVHQRASKGRKIRYTVHQQLVNFMAPEPVREVQMAPRLFRVLFGQTGPSTAKAT